MKEILSRLEAILEQLTEPEGLSAEQVGALAQAWDQAMLLLERRPEEEAFRALPAGDKLYLRVWLQRIQQRLPTVQGLLMAHKSELAKQLFSENRRFQSLSNRYSADSQNVSTLHRGA